MSTSNRNIIFDTPLREGEKNPGASRTGEEALPIVMAVERPRVAGV